MFSLNVERLRSIATKYNYLNEHMELEERDLLEPKLNQIDEVIYFIHLTFLFFNKIKYLDNKSRFK
jgi:hypothetical protein